ncbi:MAG: hypothetical protein U0269_13120 [Polyangiales bacterium]
MATKKKTAGSFVQRLLDAVSARPRTQVLYRTPTKLLTPTPADTLDKIEQAIDAKLPAPVRALYESAREFALVWQQSDAPSVEHTKSTAWNVIADPGSPFWSSIGRDDTAQGGVINIPAAKDVFRKKYWIDRLVPEPQGDTLEIDGREIIDEKLFGELYPFDMVLGYHLVGLWYDRAKKRWRAVLGDDHGAAWTDYETVSVEDYFAELERTLGASRAWRTNSATDREIPAFSLAEPAGAVVAIEPEAPSPTLGAERLAELRAWWTSAPDALKEAVTQSAAVSAQPTDAELARVAAITGLTVHEEVALAHFAALEALEYLSLRGEPDDLEPLRALRNLRTLKIEGYDVFDLQWPSKAQRSLWTALAERDLAAVDAALASGASLKARTLDGTPPIAHVCLSAYGQPVRVFEFCKALVERGADPFASPWTSSVAAPYADVFEAIQDHATMSKYFDDGEREAMIAAMKKASIAHPDESPWRRLLAGGAASAAWIDCPEAIEARAARRSQPWASDWDTPTFVMRDGRSQSLYDLHEVVFGGGFIVSNALADALKASVSSVELLPIKLLDPKKKPRKERYFYLHPEAVECLREGECAFKRKRIDGVARAVDYGALAIDEERAKGRAMFVPAGLDAFAVRSGAVVDQPVVISRALSETLRAFSNVRIGSIKR